MSAIPPKKRKKSPEDDPGWFLSTDFGNTLTNASNGKLTPSALDHAMRFFEQEAMNYARREEEDRSRQAMQQQQQNTYAQQLQSLLYKQVFTPNQLSALNQLGGVGSAYRGVMPRPRPPQKPMEEPKYKVGDEVSVRGSKDVWRVVDVRRERLDPVAEEYIYRLDGTGQYLGRGTTEREMHLTGIGEKPDLKTKVDFNTVVISDDKRNQILEALEQINQQELIFTIWGFGETIEKGRGVSMLFYGPPGTGKTLMAQALANKLEKKLKVISTADIESSAPGEAERNIRKHFKDAKKATAKLNTLGCGPTPALATPTPK